MFGFESKELFCKFKLNFSLDRIRWNQCVELVNKKMGMAVGALFIRDNFDPKSKETALEMIHNIRTAFNELLDLNEWMDDPTRKVAKEKANSINERIGYPELLTNPIELSKEYHNVRQRTSLVRKQFASEPPRSNCSAIHGLLAICISSFVYYNLRVFTLARDVRRRVPGQRSANDEVRGNKKSTQITAAS